MGKAHAESAGYAGTPMGGEKRDRPAAMVEAGGFERRQLIETGRDQEPSRKMRRAQVHHGRHHTDAFEAKLKKHGEQTEKNPDGEIAGCEGREPNAWGAGVR